MDNGTEPKEASLLVREGLSRHHTVGAITASSIKVAARTKENTNNLFFCFSDTVRYVNEDLREGRRLNGFSRHGTKTFPPPSFLHLFFNVEYFLASNDRHTSYSA